MQRANSADREVVNSKTTLRRTDWVNIPSGESMSDDRSCIIDTGFNGCDICSFNSTYIRAEYLQAISPKIPKIHKSIVGELKFVFRKPRAKRFDAFDYFTDLGS